MLLMNASARACEGMPTPSEASPIDCAQRYLAAENDLP